MCRESFGERAAWQPVDFLAQARRVRHLSGVKFLLAVLFLASALAFPGCANEGPTAEELQDRLGKGIRGEGQLTPDIDRSNDPYVKPRGGAW